MVIMPVRRYDLLDSCGWINLHLTQILERSRVACCRIDTGIHDEPGILAEMQDHALTVARTEERNL
jgi:hypothetical protein